MSRSRLASRTSLADDCSPRHKVLWFGVARARLRLPASISPGRPPLTSTSSLPELSSKERQPAQAAPARTIGGGGPASTRTTVDPLSSRTYPERATAADDDVRPSS